MRPFTDSAKAWLLHHDGWLFLSALLFSSYVFTQTGGLLGWGVFYGIFILQVLLFSPLLAYVFWRSHAVAPFPFPRLIWSMAFLILPAVMLLIWPERSGDLLPWSNGEINPPLVPERVGGLVIWWVLLGLEMLLRWNRSDKQSRLSNRLFKVPLIYWAVLAVAVFSLLIVPAGNYYQAYVAELSSARAIWIWLGAAAQTFVVYLSYYPIYYVHHHFLFNRLLRHQGFPHYLLGAVGFLLLFVPAQGAFIRLFPVVEQFKIHPLGVVPEVFADANFLLPLSFFLLSLPFIVAVEWYRQVNALDRMEREKTATELQLLKQQINPHFFFNTLNNLYAMSLTQEKETPETILKLSELMRYVIYQGPAERVPLKAEIQYLRDYLELQRLRLYQQLDLQFIVDIEDEQRLVPPLIFVIFVENAFKHGIEPSGEQGFLHLELTQRADRITFRCHNSVSPEKETSSSGGLGLSNLGRRLAVAFPERHTLHSQDLDQEYIVKLSLEL